MEVLKEKFSVNQVCEFLDEKAYNLKYLEKVLGLNIERDMFSHKLYTKEDIEIIKKAKELKNESGLRYEEIKKRLYEELNTPVNNGTLNIREKEIEEVNCSNSANGGADPKSINHAKLDLDEEILEKIESRITDKIIDKLSPIISKEIDDLKTSIIIDMKYLIKQNTDMKTNLELEIEKYFNEMDIKLDTIKKNTTKKSRSILKRYFR